MIILDLSQILFNG